jgi:hypothetical protein
MVKYQDTTKTEKYKHHSCDSNGFLKAKGNSKGFKIARSELKINTALHH